MIVRIFRTEEEFRALEKEWNPLLRRSLSDNIFLTWEWMHTWWKYYGEGKSLFIITVRDDDGRLIGLAPLCIKKVSFHGLASLKTVTFLGTDEVCSEYLDFITSPDRNVEVLKAVFDCLGSQSSLWDYILLSDMSETSGNLGFILDTLDARKAGYFMSETKECPYIELPGSYEAYLQRLGKNTRYTLAKRARTLEERFRASFSVYNSLDDIEKVMEKLFELHGKRVKMTGEESKFLLRNLMVFHKEVSQLLNKSDVLRIYALSVGHVPVAMLYGFKYNNRFSYYQSGMDPEYEKHSVGMVLMGNCIRDSIADGLKEFDFLRGDEAYKYKWTKTLRKTVNIVSGSGTFKGKIFMSAESLLLRAKSVMRKNE